MERNEDIMPKSKIPENMTLEEAAEFWDEHSALDYDDVQAAHFAVDLGWSYEGHLPDRPDWIIDTIGPVKSFV